MAQLTVGGLPKLSACFEERLTPYPIIEVFWPQLTQMVAFLASNISLTGDVSMLMRMFPALQVIDLSHNKLSGVISDLPAHLLVGDLASNEFRGELPSRIQVNIDSQLLSLSVVGNPEMRAAKLPGYLEPFSGADQLVSSMVFPDSHYSCPLLTDAATGTTALQVDPSYYAWTLCNCLDGYIGVVDPESGSAGCQPLDSLCIIPRANELQALGASCGRASGRSLQLAPGWWPSPQPQAARRFIWCGEELCNPRGTVTCVSQSFGSPLVCTAASSSEYCATGYRSRLCSQCDVGYFAALGKCTKCTHSNASSSIVRNPWSWILLLVLLSVALLLEWMLTRDTRSSNLLLLHAVRTRELGLGEPGFSCRALVLRVRQYSQELVLVVLFVITFILVSLLGIATVLEEIVLIVGLAVLVLFVFAAKANYLRNAELASRATRPQTATQLHALFRIMLVYLQMLASLVDAQAGVWTPSLSWFVRLIQRVNVRWEGLDCVGWSYGNKLVLFCAMLPALIGTVAIMWAARRATYVWRFARSRARLEAVFSVNGASPRGETTQLLAPVQGSHGTHSRVSALRNQFAAMRVALDNNSLAMVFFLAFVFAFPITQHTLTVLHCAPSADPLETASYMVAAPWISCQSHSYQVMATVAGVTLVAVVALVLGAGWLLSGAVLRARRRARDLSPVLQNTAQLMFGIFGTQVWWFEFVILARRFAVALVLSLLPPVDSPVVAGSLIVALLLVSLVVQCRLRPFLSSSANLMEELSLAALAFSYVVMAMSFLNPRTSADDLTVVGSSIIALNGVVVCIFLFHVVRIVIQPSSDSESCR
ncbi:uncharacterized protein AMSG_00882 [Thecamonas trahens ATCC 50062]|uniref:Uncharacterized protein n=1 Tax=Thecamonas trahens ATCC 50062 TaxID=461836 RepID=A0A0L0DIK4_THETB|nr:hypothetical protein AMSG_00882 [Thecamonas trahens ATCC 50062]KNC52055.1 hypothetical protein AMSG_00882 [Thecamonas trahens ATCC 50062]|eukprot:XP_013762061.1 hypothetical protein AMSG_00882 [Thecamonas trahens ATCC 50062]